MASPSVNIAVTADCSALHSQMQSAVDAVESGAEQMTAAGEEAAAGWKTATAAVEEHAVAQRASAAAIRQTTGAIEMQGASLREAKGAAALFGEEVGVNLNRHLRSVLAESSTLGPLLQAAFPLAAAIGFFDVIKQGAEALSQLIADTFIYTDAMKAAYAAQLQMNKGFEDAANQQKQLRDEIFAQTHTEAQVAQKDLQDEQAHNAQIIAQIKAKQDALAGVRQEITAQASSQRQTYDTNVKVGAAEPGQFAPHIPPELEQRAQGIANDIALLNKQLETSGLQTTKLANDFKQAQEDAKGVTGAAKGIHAAAKDTTEALAQQLQTTRQLHDAQVEGAQKTVDLNFQMGRAGFDEEIKAERDAVNQKLGIDTEYYEAKKQLAQQQTQKDPAAGKAAYASADASETEARLKARNDQLAIDVKVFQEEYEANKAAIEQELAATRVGTEEHRRLQLMVSEYVRAIWGGDSKQYAEALKQQTEADRQWSDEHKRAMQEAAHDLDEYTRKLAESKLQGTSDAAMGQMKGQEDAVRGQAQLGRITAEQEAQQIAAIHQREVAEEISTNQAKIAAIQEFLAKQKALLAQSGGAGGGEESQKIVRDMQQANLQIQQLMNQRVQMQQKADQQQLQDQLTMLQRAQQAYQQWAQAVGASSMSGFNAWLQHQKTFSQAMKQEWNQIAMDTIRAIEQYYEKKLITDNLMKLSSHLFHMQDVGSAASAAGAKKSIDATQLGAQTATQAAAMVETSFMNVSTAASYAEVAAAAALSSTAAIPVVGPALAPASAAAMESAGLAFAAMAAFELGGVVPKTQVALVHGGERVLTPQQNNTFENIVNQSSQSQSASRQSSSQSHSLSVTHNIHALDATGLARVLRKNKGAVLKEARRALQLGAAGRMGRRQ